MKCAVEGGRGEGVWCGGDRGRMCGEGEECAVEGEGGGWGCALEMKSMR